MTEEERVTRFAAALHELCKAHGVYLRAGEYETDLYFAPACREPIAPDLRFYPLGTACESTLKPGGWEDVEDAKHLAYIGTKT